MLWKLNLLQWSHIFWYRYTIGVKLWINISYNCAMCILSFSIFNACKYETKKSDNEIIVWLSIYTSQNPISNRYNKFDNLSKKYPQKA